MSVTLPTDSPTVTGLLLALADNPGCVATYSAAVDAMQEMVLIADEAHMRADNVRDAASCDGLASFIIAYKEAALFTSTIDDAGTPMDRDYFIADIADDSSIAMRQDSIIFLSWCCHLIDGNYIGSNSGGWSDFAMAGHDFWMTRCGHGVGFWDGDWLDEDDLLNDMAKAFGEDYLLVGDDGQIHCY